MVAGIPREIQLDKGQSIRTLVIGEVLEKHIKLQEYLQFALSMLHQCVGSSHTFQRDLETNVQDRLIFSEPAHIVQLVRLLKGQNDDTLWLFAELYLFLLHRYGLVFIHKSDFAQIAS